MDRFMEEIWNGERYRQARQLVNFRINPDRAPIPMSCANCVLAQTPFRMLERGFPVPDKLKKRIESLTEGDRE